MPENAINPAVRQIHERVFLVATCMNDRESNHCLLLRHNDKSISIQTKENLSRCVPTNVELNVESGSRSQYIIFMLNLRDEFIIFNVKPKHARTIYNLRQILE